MRFAISSSPRPQILAIAFVGSLVSVAPAWGATWHRSQTIACCPEVKQTCKTVCSLKGLTPVTSITDKRTYRVCRRGSGGETNRPGYQNPTGAYQNSCRVDDKHPSNPVPFDCLCD
jgi:hypothetical protein